MAGVFGGYDNDVIGLAILNPVPFLVEITGDEQDNPASPLEGNNDSLALAGVIDPASLISKIEHQLVVSAEAAQTIPSEEAGVEYLTEPVGEEMIAPEALVNHLFLPLITH